MRPDRRIPPKRCFRHPTIGDRPFGALHSLPTMPDNKPRLSRTTPYRSHHRAQAHASAHADDEAVANQAIPAHDLIPDNKPDLVTDPAGLAKLVDELKAAGSFAYDSEFIGELSYIPKLCLVQVATAAKVSLIDPIDGLDLKPFWELIADPSIEKLVHAGQQDIEPIFRHLPGQMPANIFDTQIAAGFAAFPYPVALLKLVGEIAGVKLSKGFTFTDWEHRPLSASQLRYAADDVRYLPLIRKRLGEKLDFLGHADSARAACDDQLDADLYSPDPEGNYHRLRGGSSLDSRHLAVLRALCIWRDKTARRENIPARTVLRDEVVLAMARQPVKTIDKLPSVKGLPRPIETQYGADLVALTLAALDSPKSDWPAERNNDESAREKFQTDSLLAAAQAICYAQSIDPALVFSRADIADLLKKHRENQPQDETRLFQGWRNNVAGEAVEKLLADIPHV